MSEIKQVTDWIDAAQQEPSVRNVANYAAYVISECGEMLATMGFGFDCQNLENLSKQIRAGIFDNRIQHLDRVQLMDDAADVVWTGVGLMHMLGDARGAFGEVIRSNYSKFEGGVCALDETGKVIKGPSFSKPDLAKFLR